MKKSARHRQLTPPPSLSIITVSWNAAATIEHTIRSVLSQAYDRVEYIVVDGGSTDGTTDIIDRYRSRIDKVIIEKDRGIYDAMRKGIEASRNEIVGFLNADDFYFDRQVLIDVALAFDTSEIDCCYGDLVYVDKMDTGIVKRYWRSSEFAKGAFRLGWTPPHPTFFVKKNIYETLGNFDLDYRLAGDFELMLRLLEKHRIATHYIPRVLVCMRTGGVTNKAIGNVIRQNLEILSAFKKHSLPVNLLQFMSYKVIRRLKEFSGRKNYSLNNLAN